MLSFFIAKILAGGKNILNYIQFGKGEDIVFLHGWGGSTDSFLGVAKKLSADFRVTLLDFNGFGKSPEPKTPMSVSDYAFEVLVVLNDAKIERATFVGHSFGGRVAIELCAHHSNRVNKLVLVDSAGLRPRRGLRYYAKVIAHKVAKKLGFKGLAGSKDYATLSPIMKLTFKSIVNYNQKPLLSHINVRTAIFWGDKDLETKPYMARVLKRNIRDSDLFWLSGGHFAYIEDFHTFVVVLKAFLLSRNQNIL